MYVVYKHTCPNGKVYIGITGISPTRRWQCGKNYITNTYFYRAIEKYGWDNIKHEILFEGLTKDEASSKEVELIALYKSDQRDFGYNICQGGEINIPSELTRKRMSAAHKGKKLSEAQRKKLSEAAMGKPGTMTGKHHSAETRQKIAANQHRTKVYQYSIYGKFISVYESVAEASRQTAVSREAITGVMSLTNPHKSAKGFIFTKEKFNMTNYQETLINVRKELMKCRNNIPAIKPLLEDLYYAIPDISQVISAEQSKIRESLKPMLDEIEQIKTLLPKKLAVPDLSYLKAEPAVLSTSAVSTLSTEDILEKLSDKIVSRLTQLSTIIINVITEEE